MEFGANKVASVDPETLEIHEYVLPHEESRPRRVAITPDDVIYYSDYSRGYLGRFDKARAGAMTEWLSPGGPKSQPYAITIVNGIVWYSESNTKPNTIVRFDPQDGEVPDLGDSFGRRSGAEHGAFAGWADAVDRMQRDEPDRGSADQGDKGFAEELRASPARPGQP